MILKIIIGLIVGFVFGYSLQRTGITKYPRVMGMLLLKDFKILKFMLTAVTFSMIGFYTLDSLGIIELNPKPLDWGKLVGGLIFGAGMGLLGYCPGTMLSRIGEGKRDAWLGLLGTVMGMLFFAINIDFFKKHLTSKSVSGDISAALGISQWIIVPLAAVIFVAIIYVVNKKVSDFRKNF
ncbi:MAG: DUF6691 family protein [Bacteroidales bacterium]|nr:DUF6691 family protein [Bacteroidales bacterium]